jgi:hypothetical protein
MVRFLPFPLLLLLVQHVDWNLPDGGVKVSMLINNKFTCASNAIYGDKAQSDSGMGGMGGKAIGKGNRGLGGGKSSTSIKTISKIVPCLGPFPVKKGDTLKLVALYDLSKHPLRSTGTGKAADVMGMMEISFSAARK